MSSIFTFDDLPSAAAPPPAPSPSGTSQPSLFSTLRSALASGRVSTGHGLNVHLVHCVNPETFCRGVIAGGEHDRWCTKPAGTCTFQTHATNKAHVPANALLICCPKRGQARVSPTLPTAQVPPDVVLQDLLQETRPDYKWVQWFKLLTASNKDTSPNLETVVEGVSQVNQWEGHSTDTKHASGATTSSGTSSSATLVVEETLEPSVDHLGVKALGETIISAAQTGIPLWELVPHVDHFPSNGSVEDKLGVIDQGLERFSSGWEVIRGNMKHIEAHAVVQGRADTDF